MCVRVAYACVSTSVLQVAGTSGKALLEGGSDDEGSSTEAHGRAIIEVLGREKRDEILSALYMVRTDVSISVRQVILDYKLCIYFLLLTLYGIRILIFLYLVRLLCMFGKP